MTDPLVTLLRTSSQGTTTDDWGTWHQYRDLETLAATIRAHIQESHYNDWAAVDEYEDCSEPRPIPEHDDITCPAGLTTCRDCEQRVPDSHAVKVKELRRKFLVQDSCPTRLMDGRNEIRCWLTAGHEGDL